MYKSNLNIMLASTLVVLLSAISAEAVTITTTSLPNATVGSTYSQALAATGGTAPYSWKAITAMPAGILLGTGGVVKGIPTTTGKYSFIFVVTDAKGATANAALGLTVVKTAGVTKSWGLVVSSPTPGTTIPAPLTISTSSLTNGNVGTAYSLSLIATGGTTPYTWSVASGALPPGMVLGNAGLVKGTPTSSGSYSFTAQVLDSTKTSASYTYSLTIVTP